MMVRHISFTILINRCIIYLTMKIKRNTMLIHQDISVCVVVIHIQHLLQNLLMKTEIFVYIVLMILIKTQLLTINS